MSSLCLAFVGDGSVGKSSCIRQLTCDDFSILYKQTIGFDCFERVIVLQGQRRVSIRLVDCGGQSLGSSNLSNYLSGCQAVLVLYDVTNQESFKNTEDWVRMTRKHAANKAVRIYLVGTKTDLYDLRQVSAEQHAAQIVQCGLQGGFFASAKTGDNILREIVRISGESLGLSLTDTDLGIFDKVVSAHVQQSSSSDEGRTTFAEDIEAQDLALEEIKRRREANNAGCNCTVM